MTLYAPLLSRKKEIQVKIETDKGTGVSGDSALHVYDLDIKPTADMIERQGTGKFLGREQVDVLGALTGECSFKAELRGNDSGGLDAGLAILLQACAFVKTLEVYNLDSDFADHKTISIDVYEDGVRKEIEGAMGTVTFDGEVGGIMMLDFTFSGRWVAPTDQALPGGSPGTTIPMRIQGGTFTLGGESIKIGKFSLNINNELKMREDVDGLGGLAHYMITNFDPELSIDPEADKIAGYDFNGLWLSHTPAAVSLALGNGTDVATIVIPVFQFSEIPGGDRGGIAIYDITGKCLNSSGDDTVTMTISAA